MRANMITMITFGAQTTEPVIIWTLITAMATRPNFGRFQPASLRYCVTSL